MSENQVILQRTILFCVAIFQLSCLPSLPLSAADVVFNFDYRPDRSFPEWPASVKRGPVSGVGADRQGKIYVLQREQPPVLCFNSDGKYLKSFGGDLIGDQGKGGHGLTVDSQDHVWITDTSRHVVFHFSPEGQLVGTLGTIDRPGENADQFNKPTFILFGPERFSFVIDGYGNSRVVRYESGQHPEFWGSAGSGPLQFNQPHAAVIDRQGRLLVCDRDNLRIQVIDPRTGRFLAEWSGFKPFGIAIDRAGNLFISDEQKSQIHQLNDDGKILRSWGKAGTEPGEFTGSAHLISIDHRDNLLSAEVAGRRVQRLNRIPLASLK